MKRASKRANLRGDGGKKAGGGGRRANQALGNTAGVCLALCALAAGATLVFKMRGVTPGNSAHAPPAASAKHMHLPGALSDADIASIYEIERGVWENKKYTHLANTSRSFGLESEKGQKNGHAVTFIHLAMKAKAPALLKKLQKLVFKAETKAGWGLSANHRLTPRCIEVIRYYGGAPTTADGAPGGSFLNWHDDEGSYITASFLLSDKSAFEGGGFQIMSSEVSSTDAINYTLQKHDGMVWQAWEQHRVAPITAGERQVLVIEWWDMPRNDSPQVGRPDLNEVDFMGQCRRLLKNKPLSSVPASLVANCGMLYCGLLSNTQQSEKSLLRGSKLLSKAMSMLSLSNQTGNLTARHWTDVPNITHPLGVRYGFQFALCLCYQLTLGEGKPPHLIDMILALYNNILALKGTSMWMGDYEQHDLYGYIKKLGMAMEMYGLGTFEDYAEEYPQLALIAQIRPDIFE